MVGGVRNRQGSKKIHEYFLAFQVTFSNSVFHVFGLQAKRCIIYFQGPNANIGLRSIYEPPYDDDLQCSLFPQTEWKALTFEKM